ncbi:hypothetical protein C0J50_18971 [Silurus asotus]|uniref:Uncharacterized protein n=1 Tax=Silurus asotus TaxID=30991 RepID=A0AAD5AU37_SILAS|nr:hypothetical protein C0J50_18971 [Silurus asotus]
MPDNNYSSGKVLHNRQFWLMDLAGDCKVQGKRPGDEIQQNQYSVSELLVPSPPDTDNNIHDNRGASPTPPPTNKPRVWAESERPSASRGPISAFVFTAGAGDCTGNRGAAALQDRRVSPEPEQPEAVKASQADRRRKPKRPGSTGEKLEFSSEAPRSIKALRAQCKALSFIRQFY